MYNLIFRISKAEINEIKIELADIDNPTGMSGSDWLISKSSMLQSRTSLVSGVASNVFDIVVGEAFMNAIPTTLAMYKTIKIIGCWNQDGSPFGWHYEHIIDPATLLSTKTLIRNITKDMNNVGTNDIEYPFDALAYMESMPDDVTYDDIKKTSKSTRPTAANMVSTWAGWGERHG